jgi:hypothetical protein
MKGKNQVTKQQAREKLMSVIAADIRVAAIELQELGFPGQPYDEFMVDKTTIVKKLQELASILDNPGNTPY